MKTRIFNLIAVGLILFLMPGKVVAVDWFDPDWDYRTLITIDNNDNPSDLTYYPVIVELNSGDFDFSLADPNGQDLLFTEDDGTTLIDFWIEDYNSAGESALIWVEVPNIPASNSLNVYVYHDSFDVNSASDGTATFDLFDHFDTGIDASKWTNSGGTAANSVATISTANAYIRSKQSFQYKALRCKGRFEVYANYGYLGFNSGKLSVGTNDAMFVCWGGVIRTITSDATGFDLDDGEYDGMDWKIWEILWQPGQADFYVDGFLEPERSHTSHVPSIALTAQMNSASGAPTVRADWILVRKYSSPEPNATLGSSEPRPPIPEIVTTAVTEALVNQLYSYDVNADGNLPISYQLDVSPNGMTIDPNTGLIQWTPTLAQLGTHDVTVKATNSYGSDYQSYYLTVSEPVVPSDWGYRRLITIDNTANPDDLTNYPVRLGLDANSFDFNDVDPNKYDIRFTKDDGVSAIDYWIETWDSNSQDAIIWVEIPEIHGSGTVDICMYYGNPDANDASDGDATFDLFDDFDEVISSPPGLYGDWPRVVVDDALDGSHNVLVEDVDDDNKPDLVVDAYRAEVVVWYKQPADPVNDPWPKYVIDNRLENAHDIQIGDIDGDGLQDVVGLSLSSTWQDYGAGEGYVAWYKKPADPLASGSTGWTSKTPLPYSQGDGSAALYNDEIYVFGGHYLGVSDPRNEAYKYDPNTDTWTQLTNMPTARWGLIAVECNDLIHVFAGQSASGATAVHEIYDPNADTWAVGTDVPSGLANQGLMGIRYNNKIHLFYGQYHYEYDPNTDIYTSKANVPTPRTWATCALVDNKIYLIGGHSGGATNVTETYDPNADTWATGTPMPVSKYGVTRENPVINGKIYVTHGLNGGFHTDNYVYTPATDTWEQKSSGINPRDGVQSAVVNNKLYVIAGRDDYINGGTGTNYVEEYDPSQDAGESLWTKTIIAHSGAGGLLGARASGLGDIDSDGDLDIAVAVDSSPGRLYWYDNPGGSSALDPNLWDEYLIDATQARGADAQVEDIDADGNPDIVYADVPSAVYIHFAPPDPTNIGGWTRVKVAGDTYHVYLVDFDSDGDVDILRAAAYSSLISWLENPGGIDARTPANWQEYIIEQDPSIYIANRVSAADIDGDGDLDIGMDADPSSSTGTFKWYRRPDDPTDVGSYDIYVIDNDPAYTAYAHDSDLGDIDMDGDIDMAGVGPNAHTVMWWINDPNGTSETVIDPNKWSNGGATAVDGIVTVNTPDAYIRSKDEFLYKAMRCESQFEIYADYGDIGFNSGKVTVGANDIAFTCFGTPKVQSITSDDTDFSWGYSLYEGTDWKKWEIMWTHGEVKFYVDDVLRDVNTATVPTVPLTVQFNTYQGSPTVNVGWVLVRNYSPAEPNATVGPEMPLQLTCWEAAECAGQKSGDATCDGNVNFADLFALKANFGKSAPWTASECCSDYSQNGAINFGDLFILKTNFGTSGYSPSTGNQQCPNWLMTEDPNLVGYWEFNQRTGITAWDSSCIGNHGTLVNGPVRTDSGELLFDGADDYVEVPDSNSLDFDNEVSISVWVYLNAYGSDWPKLVIKPHSAYDEPWEVYCIDLSDDGNNPRMIITDGIPSGTVAVMEYPDYILSLNQWYHIVGTYDGSSMSLYVDGQPIANQPTSIQIGQNDMPLSIGGRLGEHNSFDGLIDEVRIYDRALLQNQVQQLYQSYLEHLLPDDMTLIPAGTFEMDDMYVVRRNKTKLDLN